MSYPEQYIKFSKFYHWAKIKKINFIKRIAYTKHLAELISIIGEHALLNLEKIL